MNAHNGGMLCLRMGVLQFDFVSVWGFSMMRKLLLATVCAAGLSMVGPTVSFAATDDAAPGMSAEQQAALNAQVSAVEALVIQYKDDPAGLQAAVEALVVGAADPELSSQAVLIAFNNSQNEQVRNILASNSELGVAGGNGLGAAIASIGVTNPELASKLSASVIAGGNSGFVAAVQTGSNTKTASLNKQKQQQNNSSNNTNKDSTPENPASAS